MQTGMLSTLICRDLEKGYVYLTSFLRKEPIITQIKNNLFLAFARSLTAPANLEAFST